MAVTQSSWYAFSRIYCGLPGKESMARSARQRFLRPSFIALGVVVLLLIGLRIALPTIVTNYLNGILATLPGHEGYIEDVDLQLWRGAYSIHGIRIDQIDDNKREPLFLARDMYFSVSWRALFRGHLVAEAEVIQPKVNIVAEAKPEDVKEEKIRLEDLVDRFKEFLPFVLDRFVVTEGELHFGDPSANPPINFYVDKLSIIGENLTNSEELAGDLWGTVSGTGRAMGSGDVQIEMRVNPSEKYPTYQMAFELRDLKLQALNDYLKHYLSVEARDGRLSLFAESTAKNGKFKGYVKPVVKDLDVLHLKQERKSVGEAVKGFFVKLMASIFENDPKQQIATKVEFAGSFESPEVGVWDAAIAFIRNAFVQALRPSLDATVAPRQAEKALDNNAK